MNRHLVSSLAALLLVSSVRADSIDDAEAKRRGVTVAQVQAENALAKEKLKTASLEKQVADVQKKITDLKAPDGAATPGTATAAPGVAEPELKFDGPRGESPLYDDFMKRYMDGDWEKLGADMEAKKKEIAALPAGNAADLTYILRALAESRPIWWNDIKNGKSKDIRQLVWKQPLHANFETAGIGQLGPVSASGVVTVSWPRERMDSHEMFDVMVAGLNFPGDFGFKWGDAVDTGIWQVLTDAATRAPFSEAALKGMAPDDQVIFTRYNLFRQNTTAGYYCTPPGRRLICALSLSSLESAMNGNSTWVGRRPLGSALLIELKQNKSFYTNFEVKGIPGLIISNNGDQMEQFVSKPVALEFLHNKPTFDQDRRIREMIKTLALSNVTWSESRLSLPAGLAFELDPPKDVALAAERLKVVNP